MENIASPPRRTSSLVNNTSELALRVHGTQYDGQVIRLRGPKFTIGSGGNCTLRLNARGVAPVQFLIYRGLGQTIVRPWAKSSRLNGRPFVDAVLAVGDRLGFGPIEFEVVEANDSETAAPLPVATTLNNIEPPKPVTVTVVENLLEMSQIRDRLAMSNRQGRRRARKLIEKLREFERRELRIGADRQALAKENSLLAAQMAQLAAERERFQQQQNESDAQLTAASRRLNEQSTDLRAKLAEMSAQRDQLIGERAGCDQQHRLALLNIQNAEAELAERRDRLSAELNELSAERRALETTRALWKAEQAAAAVAAAEHAARIENSLDELRRKRSDLEAAQQTWQIQQEQLESHQQFGEQHLAQLREQVASDEAAFAVQQHDFAVQQQRSQAELELAQASLQQRIADFDRLQSELDARAEQLLVERREWEAEQNELREDLANQSEYLLLETARLEDRRQQFEATRDGWQVQQQLDRAKHANDESALQQLSDELRDREATFADEQTTWQSHRDGGAAYLAEQRNQLDERIAACEIEQQQLATLRDAFELDRASLLNEQAALAASRQQLFEQTEALRREQVALDEVAQAAAKSVEIAEDAEQREAVEAAERDANANLQAAAELDARAAELNCRESELQTQLTDLESQRAAVASQLEAMESQQLEVAAQRDAVEAQSAEIRTQQEELDFRQEELLRQQAELAQLQVELDRRQAALEQPAPSQPQISAEIVPETGADETDADELSIIERAAAMPVSVANDPGVERSAWQSERQELLADIARLRDELEAARAEFNSQQADAQARNTDESECSETVADSHVTDAQRERLTAEWDELQQQRQVLESEMRSQQQSLDERTALLDGRCAQMESQLKQLIEHREQLVAQTATWNAQKEAEEARLMQQAEQLSQLQSQPQQIIHVPAPQSMPSFVPAVGPAHRSEVGHSVPASVEVLNVETSRGDQHNGDLSGDDGIELAAAQAAAQWRQGAAPSVSIAENCALNIQQSKFAPEPTSVRIPQGAQHDDQVVDAVAHNLPASVVQCQEVLPASGDAPQSEGESAGDDRDIFARLRALALLKNDSEDASADESQPPADEVLHPAKELSPYERFKQAMALEQARQAETVNETSASEPAHNEQQEEPSHFGRLQHERSAGNDDDDSPVKSEADVAAPPAGGEDESVEDYMARLLNRMRSDKPAHGPAKRENAQPKSAAVSKPTQPAAAEVPLEPLKSLPRSHAPVLTADLSAMRELANQSARAAIHTHQRKGIVFRVAEQSAVGAGVTVLGGGLVWWSNLQDAMPMYGGLGAMAFGLAWIGWAVFKVLAMSRPMGLPTKEADPVSSDAAVK